jgi:hypothetical protein
VVSSSSDSEEALKVQTMKSSGRASWLGVLPLLVLFAACTDPVVNLEEPAEVDSCERLIPVGIELVNDYVYTLAETDLGGTAGDAGLLPTSLVALNSRGQELDARAAELDCDLDVLNRQIVESTVGIESDDPVVQAFLETVRGGVVAVASPIHGAWKLDSGLDAVSGYPITLEIDEEAARGSAGCNGYYMPVVLSEGVWMWGEGAATITDLMCLDDLGEPLTDVLSAEVAFIGAFDSVAAYALDGDVLVLTGPAVELRFSRASVPSAGN